MMHTHYNVENGERIMMVDEFGESKVTVKKDELLEAIRKNRDGHRTEFERAQAGYRTAVIEELDRMLRDAREGRRIRRAIELVEPQDHTKDYDRVVRMLEMSTATEIVITEKRRGRFYLDGREIRLPGYPVPTPIGSGAFGRLGVMDADEDVPAHRIVTRPLWFVELSLDVARKGGPW